MDRSTRCLLGILVLTLAAGCAPDGEVGGAEGEEASYSPFSLPAAVERWRPLVEKHFPRQHVSWAMNIMRCESTGNPNAYNASSGASGLFQQLKKFWPARAANAGWAGYSPFHAEANISTSAYLLAMGGPGHWECKHSPLNNWSYVPRFFDDGRPVGCQARRVAGAESSLFKDMPPGKTGYSAAIKLFQQSITNGCQASPYRAFCPDCDVTREQMAAFLRRAAHLPVPKDLSAHSFSDVPATSSFRSDIAALAAAGITNGCGGGKFCPKAKVTRGQVAAFLVRTLGWGPKNSASPSFSDVPRTHTFYGDIERLAEKGVTKGCGGGKFCPAATVPRNHMALFLVRAFKL